MPMDLTDVKSTLIKVMAWCRQATSHYLSQCWLSPLSPYGVARPQRVKLSHTLCVYATVTLWLLTWVEVQFGHTRGVGFTILLTEAEHDHRRKISLHDHLDNLETARFTCKKQWMIKAWTEYQLQILKLGHWSSKCYSKIPVIFLSSSNFV